MSKETGLILLLCTSIAAVSFWLGRSSPIKEAVTVQTVSNESYKTALQGLEQKMRQISEQDLAEYNRLKDRRAQYEKAEEILAKILQIFVADLGLRINKGDLDKLAKHQAAPAAAPAPVETVAQAPPPPKKKAETPPPTSAAPSDSLNWKVMERKLGEVRNEGDAEGFLKSVMVDNLFPSVRTAKPAMRSKLDHMVGRYRGQIRMTDAGQQPSEIEMELSLNPGNELAEGEYRIKISQNGNVQSDSNGKGNFKDYYTAGDSAAIIVRTTPQNYLQLYWSAQLNQFFGNYYQADSVDKYTPVGVVFLRR